MLPALSTILFGPTISPEVAQYYARLTAGESDAYKTAARGLINGLVATGAWARTDGLYIFSTTQKANSLINLKSSSFTLTQTSLADGQFTAGLGWTGDGNITHCLDTGCDPTTAPGLNFSLNAASVIGQVSAGTKTTDQFLFGNSNFYCEPYFNADGKSYWRDNRLSDLSVTAPSSLIGLWSVIQTDATTGQLRQNGASVATTAVSPTTVHNQTFRALGGSVSDASSLTIRAVAFGAHTIADADLFGTLLTTFFP